MKHFWKEKKKQSTPAPSHFPLAQVPLYCTKKAVPFLFADFDFLSIWKELAFRFSSGETRVKMVRFRSWHLGEMRVEGAPCQCSNLLQPSWRHGTWACLETKCHSTATAVATVIVKTTFGYHLVRECDTHIAVLGEHPGSRKELVSSSMAQKRTTCL